MRLQNISRHQDLCLTLQYIMYRCKIGFSLEVLGLLPTLFMKKGASYKLIKTIDWFFFFIMSSFCILSGNNCKFKIFKPLNE